MHVFVTGATGWIGSAVVKELLNAGHGVSGLTTSAKGAEKLRKMGAKPYVGKLNQHDLLRRAAADSDGVIHTAFIHALSSMSFGDRVRLFAGALNGGIVSSFMRILSATETGAVTALGEGLKGGGRPLVVASGILFLPQGKVATEQDNHVSTGPNRSFSENSAFSFIPRGIRATAIRLAPTVHGDGDHGFVPNIISSARKKGVSPYIGDGENRWTAIHRLDAAKLFRLALEKGEAGARYHGVDEGSIPLREIASLIAARLKIPAVSIAPAKAAGHFGILANFIGLDNPASSAWTRETLGWKPEQTGLLADMDAHYFKPAA